MPIQPPALDDRNFDDLLEELLTRVAAHTPEWSPRLGDPGQTLVELFAWLMDTLLYRANLIPERQRLTFLRLLGIPVRPAIAATGLVQVLWQNPDRLQAVTLAPQAKVKGAANFETRGEFTVFPVTASGFYKRKLTPTEEAQMAEVVQGLRQVYGLDQAASPYVTTPVFADVPQLEGFNLAASVDSCLWLALLAPTPEAVETVKQALGTQATGGQPLLNVGVMPTIAIPERYDDIQPRTHIPHVWELSTGREFEGEPEYLTLNEISDSTAGLRRPGIIRLALPNPNRIGAPSNDVRLSLQAEVGDRPPRLDAPDIAARLVAWLRLRPTVALTQLSLSWVGINAVEIDQRQTLKGVIIGISDATAQQAFQLPGTSIEPDTLAIEVEEPRSGYRPWLRVDDLALAGRDTAAYSLDSEAGLIRFGDGVRGRIPEREMRIRVAQMRSGGGRQGNLPAGSLTDIAALDLKAGPVTELTVIQTLATWGGEEAETLEAAEQRIPDLFRHRDRAVTEADYRQIAAQTPSVTLGRIEVLPRFKPQQRREGIPGVISVMVLPQKEAIQAPNPRPDRPTLEAVHAHLDSRRPLGTELYVIGVEYEPIGLSVGVQIQDGAGRDRVLQAVREALSAFLWPLAPGDVDGSGWNLGKTVRDRELEVVVARVAGVRSVLGLNLFHRRDETWQRVSQVGLERWQLPELETVIAVAEEPPPEDLTRLAGRLPSQDVGIAVPVVPEVC